MIGPGALRLEKSPEEVSALPAYAGSFPPETNQHNFCTPLIRRVSRQLGYQFFRVASELAAACASVRCASARSRLMFVPFALDARRHNRGEPAQSVVTERGNRIRAVARLAEVFASHSEQAPAARQKFAQPGRTGKTRANRQRRRCDTTTNQSGRFLINILRQGAAPHFFAEATQGWRKRVGVEPTILAAKDRIHGFEGHEGHRTPFASESDHANRRSPRIGTRLDESRREIGVPLPS